MLHVSKVVWVVVQTLAKNVNVNAIYTTRRYFGPAINFLSINVTRNIKRIKCRSTSSNSNSISSSCSSSSSRAEASLYQISPYQI
jgi:hypothetical protein